MRRHAAAPLAGIAGGLCWAARWVADLAGSAPAWGPTARWLGLALLVLALAAGGAGLVSRSAVWLRCLVAVAFPLLMWSVYVVLRGEGDDVGLDGVLGALAALSGVVVLITSRRAEPADEQPRSGSHAAR